MVYARRFLALVAVSLVFWVDLIAIPVYFVMTGRSYIEDYSIVEAVFEFIMTGHWNWKDDGKDEEEKP